MLDRIELSVDASDVVVVLERACAQGRAKVEVMHILKEISETYLEVIATIPDPCPETADICWLGG
jgi:hypothetical protein